MDFFEYASVASYFAGKLWIQLLVGGLCFAIVFIFEAVALFTIASREGYGHKWMAFIPFFNTYYIGVCAQKNRFYNIDTKKIGLIAAIFEFLLVCCYILFYVSCYLVSDYVVETLRETIYGQVTEYSLRNVPTNLSWAAWIYNYLDIILNVASLVYLLVEICLFICFYQTYACRRYVLFTVTSILFPIQGILFFVIRNNKGVNYREFVRNEQAKQYRIYQQYHQQQQNFYQNPYNQNPYGKNSYDNGPNNSNGQKPPEDPFGDLGGSGGSSGSPFDDYN